MKNRPFQKCFTHFDVRINYIYFEIAGRKETSDILKHSIHYNRIIETLENKNNTLHKEDIIYLLKDDGACFDEDSLRIYDPAEDACFRVMDDWEIHIEYSQNAVSLLFYVRSTNPNLRRLIEDVNEEVTRVKEKLVGRIENLEEKFKSTLTTMAQEIDKLRSSNKGTGSNGVGLVRQSSMKKAQTVIEKEPKVPTKVTEIKPSANITALRRSSERGLRRRDSIYNYREHPIESSSQDIDIALMYSEPLVKKDENGIASLGDPVDFEEECNKVLDILGKKEKKINLYFEIATIRHLVNVLSLSPTLLHIICHGDFNKAKNQFFLCFEENGELTELYSEDLKTRLEAVNFNTQLVFINACHSEEVAKVFMDAGVPCVVAVHSELKIEDSIAQKFSESFYWQLFEGKTIEQAFRHARVAITGTNAYTCCCAHSHKPDCKWYQIAKKDGYEKAHYLHTPTCTDCSKKFGNSFIHKEDCLWAMDFIMDVCQHDELPEESFHVCCCSPHLEHNEAMKFKLICKEERFSKQVLFRHKESGKVTITSTHSCVDPKFLMSKMTGRNKEAYDLFTVLSDKEKKMVNLYGLQGVGKTTLSKQVANYMVERGFFREKVCLLSLEKTPSMTYFKSNLFKELPGCYDLKTFCESIKNSRMLFILEKCDRLIKEYFDQFVQDLAYITGSAANIKFIIITNEKFELKLGESHLYMKELGKLDAAKLLCKNAFTYLRLNERNPYELAEHRVFDLISLTPQGIWSLAEKLKARKTLDEIEMELEEEKEKCDPNSEENQTVDETLRQTLQKIKESNPDTYNLLTFMCMFPSGLSYQDLEELSFQDRIPQNWQQLLYAFLRSEAFFSHMTTEGAGSQHKPEFQLRRASTLRQIDRNDFKPGNHLWINIIREPTDNELWFLPAQFLTKFIEKYPDNQVQENNLKKIEYMALLASSLIERVKRNHNYIEKMLECSSASTYGIWQTFDSRTQDVSKLQYVLSPGYSFEKLKKLFELHEANFFSCLETGYLELLSKEDSEKIPYVMDVIEAVCVGVPTLFKLMSVKQSGAMEVARKAEQVIQSLGEVNPVRTLLIKIKLNLFLVASYLESKSEMANNFILAKIQLGAVEKLEEDLRDSEIGPQVSAEILFTKALYYYKGYKTNCIKSSEFSTKHLLYQEIRNLLKRAQSLLEPIIQKDEKYRPAKAKITLVLVKIVYNKNLIEKKLLEDMNEALVALKEYGDPGLLMKANYKYASLKLDHERANLEIKMSESSALQMKNFTNVLSKIKNEYLVDKALRIAKQIKFNLYESKIKRKIDEINMEIQQTYSNVIILMRSAPLVDINQNDDDPNKTQIVPMGSSSMIVSTFKNDLTQALKQKQKALYLKFEVLTRKDLIDSLTHGCRILQLTFTSIQENCICVEGLYGTAERISFEELRNIFSPRVVPESSPILTPSNSIPLFTSHDDDTFTSIRRIKSQAEDFGTVNALISKEEIDEAQDLPLELTRGIVSHPSIESKLVEVLILAGKKNQKLVDLFIALNIPHIIAFEFSSDENSEPIYKLYESECTEHFSVFFHEELVAPRSVSDAYEIACNKVFDYLGEKYFEGQTRSYVSSIIGAGPVLFPKDTDHSELLFGPGRFALMEGKLENISTTRCLSNIGKILLPFVGRSKEMYEVMSKIHNHNGFFKVTSSPGFGRTTFVLQIGYHMLSRNMFPDGVFYIPLKKLIDERDPDYQMKDLLLDVLGLDVQFGFLNFFKDKKMLLIFDDFDLFYKKEIPFPRLFFLTIKECKIPSIVVTSTSRIGSQHSNQNAKAKQKILEVYNNTKKEIDGDLLEKGAKYKLGGLSEDELALLLQLLIQTDNYTDFASLEQLKECDEINDAGGNPKYIINKLVEGSIEVSDRELRINPVYEKCLQFEDDYINNIGVAVRSSPMLPLRKSISNQGFMERVIIGGAPLSNGDATPQTPARRISHQMHSASLTGIPVVQPNESEVQQPKPSILRGEKKKKKPRVSFTEVIEAQLLHIKENKKKQQMGDSLIMQKENEGAQSDRAKTEIAVQTNPDEIEENEQVLAKEPKQEEKINNNNNIFVRKTKLELMRAFEKLDGEKKSQSSNEQKGGEIKEEKTGI